MSSQQLKLVMGMFIASIGFILIFHAIGPLAAIGIALAMWGYQLQVEGITEKRPDAADAREVDRG